MDALQLFGVELLKPPCLTVIEKWGEYNNVVDFYLGSKTDSMLPPEHVGEPAKCQAGLFQAVNYLIIQHGVAEKYADQIVEFSD